MRTYYKIGALFFLAVAAVSAFLGQWAQGCYFLLLCVWLTDSNHDG